MRLMLGTVLSVCVFFCYAKNTVQSMVGFLKHVLVEKPALQFLPQETVYWQNKNAPYLLQAQEEHDAFVDMLLSNNIEVEYVENSVPSYAGMYTHDPVLCIDLGEQPAAIILRMGNERRRGHEEAGMRQACCRLGIPIIAQLKAPATAEGGDCLWLDESTLAIGVGFRTNEEGFAQLKSLFKQYNISVVRVDLPYYKGPNSCLHLQSLISLIDGYVAVVYKPLLPVSFLQFLINNGFTCIDVPDEEFEHMGPNILALAPKVCLTIAGNTVTKSRLEEQGYTVLTYAGKESSLKGGGGATCLTRPLVRIVQK